MPEPPAESQVAGRTGEILQQDNRFVVERHAKRVSGIPRLAHQTIKYL